MPEKIFLPSFLQLEYIFLINIWTKTWLFSREKSGLFSHLGRHPPVSILKEMNSYPKSLCICFRMRAPLKIVCHISPKVFNLFTVLWRTTWLQTQEIAFLEQTTPSFFFQKFDFWRFYHLKLFLPSMLPCAENHRRQKKIGN